MASQHVLATAGAMVCLFATATASAQEVPRRSADGHPDFSGRYTMRSDRAAATPALQGPYLERLVRLREATAAGKPVEDTGATCSGFGNFSTLTFNPYALEMVQTPGLMVWHFEGGDGVRRIYLDGRSHPENPVRKGMGHSVGHFEDDVLVIDTVGFLPTRLTPNGDSFSEQLHTVERLKFTNGGKDLLDEITVTDPAALSQPWTLRHTFVAQPDLKMLEWDCEENNRNRPDENGVTSVQGLVK